MAIVEHFCAMAVQEVARELRSLRENTDDTMRSAAQVAMRQIGALPNADYSIPEKTPDKSAFGTGRKPDEKNIPQFGSGSVFTGKRVTALSDDAEPTNPQQPAQEQA